MEAIVIEHTSPKDLIIVKQLPIIVEQLQMIKQKIIDSTNAALSLEVSENTVKEVKAVRSELAKDFKTLEEMRIQVKKKILEPYEAFERTYKSCVSDIYKPADAQLKEKIDAVENELKERKKSELVEYFNEYRASKGIDFPEFDRAGINITLSASLKSLKEQAKAFLDKVCDDLSLINMQEHSAEILVEYKQSLNVAQAVMTVTNRHKAIEEERRKSEIVRIESEAREVAEKKVEQAIEEFAPPAAQPAPEVEYQKKLLQVTFTVRGTLEQIKALKKFLNDGGFDYE